MTRSTVQGLTVWVIDKDEDFAALRERWQELYDKSPTSTPYQSWVGGTRGGRATAPRTS